jgi:ABC-type polysaccharide/polyol phosphate transport system ATPase subunit
MPSEEIVISAKNLTKAYRLFGHPGDRIKQFLSLGLRQYHREFTALQDVSFDIRRGETIGIIGRNGSGKSTLLQLICGILKPTSGSVTINGRVSALLELGAGFNPEFTGRENVFFQGAIMGLSQAEMAARFDAIAAFADIGEFIDQPVRTYSSGMFVRLAFAVAAHVKPDVFLIDEALAVGDIDFQAKCLIKMHGLVDNGVTVILVSHSMQTINSFCDRAILLDGGTVRLDGPPEIVIDRYRGTAKSSSGTSVDIRPIQGYRRGLRQCFELLALDVSTEDGRPASTFAMGDRLLLRLKLNCTQATSQARFGVLLTNSADTLIHDFASGYAGIVGLGEGLHEFEILSGPLMLYPGTYFLGAWVQRALGIPSEDYVRAALSITVEDRGKVGDPEARFNDVSKANTEVYLPCDWRRIA